MPAAHPAISRLQQRASSPLDTPTPPSSTSQYFAHLPASSIRPLNHRKPASMARGPARSSPAAAVHDISLDGTERDRRNLEDQIRRGMGPLESTEPRAVIEEEEEDEEVERDQFGFDEHSPKHGASPRRRRYDHRVHHSDTSDVSMKITFDHEKRQQQARRDDMTDDLSSISFSRTLSPRRPSPPPISHASPLSGFDGMAAELRKEFERITGGRPSPGAGKAKTVNIGSVADHTGMARRVFGEIGNTFVSSPTKTSHRASVQEATWPMPPAPAPSRVEASLPPPPSIPTPAPPRRAPRMQPRTPAPAPSVKRPTVAFSPPEHSPSPSPRRVASPPPRRPSAPTPRHAQQQRHYPLPDITGLTDGLASPEKVRGHRSYARPSHQDPAEGVLEDALNNLQDRLETLEGANATSADRVRDLERSVGGVDYDSGIGSGESMLGAGNASKAAAGGWQQQLADERDSRRELEVLVKRLRGHVARLQKQIDSHAVDIDRLRAQRQRGWTDEVATLREGMEALSNEVDQVRKLVETLAEEQGSRARLPQQTRRPSPKLFSTTEPKQTRKEEAEELDREIKRANAILGSCQQTCADCRRRVSSTTAAPKRRPAPRYATEDEGYADDEEEVDEYGGKLPPQTVLSRVLADLEADFTSHKSIFIELSDAYKAMDPASHAAKRRILAAHLRESIDVLEAKADEIKRLYDMLHYRDHPNELPSFVHRHQQRRTAVL